MKSSDVRQKYIEFFKEKGHVEIPSAKLVPENDPTTLFTTAGMQPLIPYLLGEVHPEGKRLVDSQKSLRTDDIEEVGDNTHHTFFEMLGNWSLGDYFKEEAINWSFEFLTSSKWLNIPLEKLAVSVFAGDDDAPFDEESYNIWLGLGIPKERIAKLPKKNNWWGPAGTTGPCGPDTEMFYWSEDTTPPLEFDPSDARWVEIWNDVFMQYFKKEDGSFELLKQQNVDTGMGLERTIAVLSGTPDNYKTDLFLPLIKEIEQETKTSYEGNEITYRVIADHIKAAVFLINDGVIPSNKLQGYILRRLLRRAAVKFDFLKDNSMLNLTNLVTVVLDIYEDTSFFKDAESGNIKQVISDELNRFSRTIKQGLKEIAKVERIDGKTAFDLYQTYGFPIELTQEIAKEKGQDIDMSDFNSEIEKHKQLSQTSSAGIFKGGLADHSEKTTKLHTATHLLQAAAKQVLGKEVGQRGSHITAERLRWDFNYDKKLTQEQIKEIEKLVNEQIENNLKVWFDIEERDEAIENGATTNYGENYPDKVKVYKMGSFSVELCGGPHVEHTGTLKRFKIDKEEGVSAGVRRIYATVIS